MAVRSVFTRASCVRWSNAFFVSKQNQENISWSLRSVFRRKLSTTNVPCTSKVATVDDSRSTADGNVEKGLKLSNSCVEELHSIRDKKGDKMLRIHVEGGGCSGFQYKFKLDTEVSEGDIVFEREGAKVVVDKLSLGLLEGSTIEYHQELIRSSFRVADNPGAELGCSCGVSFAPK